MPINIFLHYMCTALELKKIALFGTNMKNVRRIILFSHSIFHNQWEWFDSFTWVAWTMLDIVIKSLTHSADSDGDDHNMAPHLTFES